MQIYSHKDLEIGRQEDAVGWIDFKHSIPLEMYWHKILILLSQFSVEITVAVEPYESLGTFN